MQASLKATLDCAKAFATTDFRPDLKAVRVPTLIIHGTDDATVPIDVSSRQPRRGIAGSVLKEDRGRPARAARLAPGRDPRRRPGVPALASVTRHRAAPAPADVANAGRLKYFAQAGR